MALGIAQYISVERKRKEKRRKGTEEERERGRKKERKIGCIYRRE